MMTVEITTRTTAHPKTGRRKKMTKRRKTQTLPRERYVDGWQRDRAGINSR